MRDKTIALNEANIQYWKRPAELLALIEGVKSRYDPSWIRSQGQLQMTCRELWQGAVAYIGMELIQGREYRLHPSDTEPYDYFAATIDEDARSADYVAVQSKSIWNYNKAETKDFSPDGLALLIKRQLKKYDDDPSVTYMFYFNAEARCDHRQLHENLSEILDAEYPIWLYGLETNEKGTEDNWYLRYVYPRFREPGKHQYKIEALPTVNNEQVDSYLEHISAFIGAA